MTTLAETMAAAADDLIASIRASRAAFSHSLTKGESAEAALREFFKSYYPDSIGVARGQVMDSRGAMSKQLDVILYDAHRTPVLYTDRESGARLIPVEGVIAAVESKMNLKAADIPSIVESARVLKQMNRDAYFIQENPVIVHEVSAYGATWPRLPVMYFVFAFEGPGMDTVADALNSAHANLPTHLRIDLTCILDKGIVLNEVPSGNINALPTPDSFLCGYPTNHSLLMFHILVSQYVLQADLPPIDIKRYIPGDFVF